MRELKPGDRVRVEFEGTVDRRAEWNSRAVAVTSPDALPGYVWVYEAACTLIEPEIVLPEIPGTIVQVDPLNEHNARLAFENVENDGRSWSESGEIAIWSTSELIDQCRRYGYRVIPAAEEVES